MSSKTSPVAARKYRWLIKRILFLDGFMAGQSIAVSIDHHDLPGELEFLPITPEQKQWCAAMPDYCNPDGSVTYYGFQDLADESVYKIAPAEWKRIRAGLEERHRREREKG